MRVLSRTCLPISLLLNRYIIMENDYMFVQFEISILSRILSTDFSSVIYVYYYGNILHVSLLAYTNIISNMSTDYHTLASVYYHRNRLHVSLLGNTQIISKPAYRFLECDLRILLWKLTTYFSPWKFAYLL